MLGKTILSAAALVFATNTAWAKDSAAANVVAAALAPTTDWQIPKDGPSLVSGKRVVYLAASLRNGGILAVGEGLREAVSQTDWTLELIDARGSDDVVSKHLQTLLKDLPDAVIVGGFDAMTHADHLNALNEAGVAIVGWHAGSEPGPIKEAAVRVNVTTDPLEVAQVAAAYAIEITQGTAGAVIFTDTRYGIAVRKSDEMARVIEACGTCEVLEIVNADLDKARDIMPGLLDRLHEKYGDRWNVSLGINDIYFDELALPMAFKGIAPSGQIQNISAGDGSFTAYKRIRTGNYQAATVPEPLSFQGWQLLDELNRIFSGLEPSGFVAPTKLVVIENVDDEGGQDNIFDPENGYRDFFARLWK